MAYKNHAEAIEAAMHDIEQQIVKTGDFSAAYGMDKAVCLLRKHLAMIAPRTDHEGKTASTWGVVESESKPGIQWKRAPEQRANQS